MSLVTTGQVSLKASLSKTFDHANGNFPASLGQVLNLTSGTGANQADVMFSDQRTTASETLDLAGSLVDGFGDTITMARVKAVFIKSSADNTVDIDVGGAATNAFSTLFGAATDEIKVRPGGALMLFAPDATAYAVTAGTGDQLKIAATDGVTSVTYDIIIIGASA